MITVRPLGDADLLRPAAVVAESALVSAARGHLDQVALTLPDAVPGEVLDLGVDPGTVTGEISAVAWSGGGQFSTRAADPDGPPAEPVQLTGAASVARLLRSAQVLVAGGAESFAPSLGDLQDRMTAAWGVSSRMSVVLAGAPSVIPASGRSVAMVVSGAATIRSGGRSTSLRPGQAVTCETGPVELDADGPVVGVLIELGEFGPRSVLDQIHRRSGFDPLFRADLPRDPAVAYTCYDRSLLDAPEAFSTAVCDALDDDTWTQARCWWDASLRFSPGSLTSGLLDGEVGVRWPAEPVFLDDRLPRAQPDDVVIGIAGHLLCLASEQYDRLVHLAGSGGTFDAADDLYRELAGLGLLQGR